VNYDIDTLRSVEISILDAHQPWIEEAHTDEDREALALWLGQRFDRLALPDPVVQTMRDSGVEDALTNALKQNTRANARSILDVRVHLDENVQPPALAFLIIYDAGERNAREAAESVVEAVKKRVEAKAEVLADRLTVEGVVSVSDVGLTYAQFRKTKRWRIEHLSLRADPPGDRPVN